MVQIQLTFYSSCRDLMDKRKQFNPLAAGGTHVSISTLPEGHICPKSIDLTTFSLANKIYHI